MSQEETPNNKDESNKRYLVANIIAFGIIALRYLLFAAKNLKTSFADEDVL